MQAWLVQHANHLAEQDVNPAGAFFDDGEESEELTEAQKDRHSEEQDEKSNCGGKQNLDHFATS